MRVLYFFIFISQLLTSIASAHIEMEHNYCKTSESSVSAQDTDCDKTTDSHANHHCCSLCHVHNISINPLGDSLGLHTFLQNKLISFYYSNSYFSLIQLSVFRPPIA